MHQAVVAELVDGRAGRLDPTVCGGDAQHLPRVLLTGGRVLTVRRPDVPGGGPVAAILRYRL
ncbi:MAG TPA: hypothetical protein VGF21_05570 [Thermoleophilaceae bacterium]